MEGHPQYINAPDRQSRPSLYNGCCRNWAFLLRLSKCSVELLMAVRNCRKTILSRCVVLNGYLMRWSTPFRRAVSAFAAAENSNLLHPAPFADASAQRSGFWTMIILTPTPTSQIPKKKQTNRQYQNDLSPIAISTRKSPEFIRAAFQRLLHLHLPRNSSKSNWRPFRWVVAISRRVE